MIITYFHIAINLLGQHKTRRSDQGLWRYFEGKFFKAEGRKRKNISKAKEALELSEPGFYSLVSIIIFIVIDFTSESPTINILWVVSKNVACEFTFLNILFYFYLFKFFNSSN